MLLRLDRNRFDGGFLIDVREDMSNKQLIISTIFPTI